MALNKFYYDIQGFLKNDPDFLKKSDFSTMSKLTSVIEPRTREASYAHALSFEVFDPLWMLARQWQYGRFQGNDCGTPCMVKVRTTKKSIDTVSLTDSEGNTTVQNYSNVVPMEYALEKENREITLYVRVESAIHLTRRIRRKASGILSRGRADNLIGYFMEKCVLDSPVPQTKEADKTIEDLKIECNESLATFYETYEGRTFDGYKAYKAIKDRSVIQDLEFAPGGMQDNFLSEYVEWFENKFMPAGEKAEGCWNIRKMSYAAAMRQGNNQFVSDDYDSGNLSWYSFDNNITQGKTDREVSKMFSYIPTPTNIPGAPSQKLWAFEDRKVYMGIDDGDEFAMLANAAMMQYISMYSNDWMIVPLEAEAGTVLDVEGIIVKDTFGEMTFIDSDAEDVDFCNRKDKASCGFTQRWNLFGNTQDKAYEIDDFSVNRGLLVPSSISRNEESKPIEEVQFLRDELSNMVWAVETVIPDGCGGTMDTKTLSDAVLEKVDQQKGEYTGGPDDAEYAFLVENRVPINWIPLVPEQIPGDVRNIAFRRGKMPIYYNDKYNPVRPSTRLMEAKKDANGKIKPLYINEEEITGYGVKLVKTAQRTRWYDGRTFNWVGNKKIISDYQANSGLMFDELIESNSGKAISLDRIDQTKNKENK